MRHRPKEERAMAALAKQTEKPTRRPARRAAGAGGKLVRPRFAFAAPGLVAPAALAAAARQLTGSLREGAASETAYDTAVVSRLRSARDPGQPAFPATVTWLRRHQHADGSWGGRIETAHDRLVGTLAALVRLAELPDEWARPAVRAGAAYVWRHAQDWRDQPHETVAFELLVPALLDEARRLDLPLPYDCFAPVLALRDEKLRRIPFDALYAQPTTLVHSLEFLGREVDAERVCRLRGQNGSYGNSPSATAYVLAHARDERAEGYLRRALDVSLNGGAPTIYPFEIFERAWVLYNLAHAGGEAAGAAHLRYLAESIGAGGVGMARGGLVPDCDDTAMALIILARAGHTVDLDLLRPFEAEGWFSCFPYERNTSISVNARVLEALNVGAAPGDTGHAPRVAKVLRYLRAQRLDGRYWQDKWHVSPYYATAQVAFAAAGSADDLVAATRGWLLETQRPDGSWGRYGGTCEETAYAMQALLTLAPAHDHVAGPALARGATYLSERFADTDYSELWIGKGLYTPYAIVRSAVLSALLLYHRARRP
ncbi:MAG TPA: prenyltransferase/squalene oxidase repeat-containing protein [Thermomicrobiales bacterium]|nr:prenyltransferase/squalene oxidase repeat-containing protein [Thermomicrobiales bacterium]